ncbi:DUF775-domain-containing protein [Coprinopsis marcescibilis]|uniref:DUF775-domain-containing protein n=1 Tax=Coprinopsis marcescibilis TaxID=230819 RepID=A0A5C3LA17_COPMA|nr:DUF775-domain-containing protein [Coprinopsis marcescibilis]
MFGCCVAGRPLQTNLIQVDETHAYFELPFASSINHVCVFLLGTVPFPEGYGATVHFFWPGKGFQLLGMLSNDKPSAIFRLRGTFTSAQTPNNNAQNVFSAQSGNQQGQGDVIAILGLAIEPLSAIQAQIASLPAGQINPALNGANSAGQPSANDVVLLAERIVKHLFNYIGGFTGANSPTADIAVPMNVIVKWYENFSNKLRTTGIGFLERQDLE